MMIDVAWMGRDPRPIVVKNARRIERDSRWRGVKGLAIGLTISAFLWAVIAWALAGFFS